MDKQTTAKDYSSISPSARALLLLKGYTNIPFAAGASAIISHPHAYNPHPEKLSLTDAFRTLHFEARYRSIDEMLVGTQAKNILELSSGFSFRGLAMVQHQPVHYIDTDLPALITTKQSLIAGLKTKLQPPVGQLEVLPLNALDMQQFAGVVNRFSPGEITIVNEGLLMYLGMEEKRQLCAIVRRHLGTHGGCWITADIYVKPKMPMPQAPADDALTHFLEDHKVNENMFDSFDEARAFFDGQGFIVNKELAPDYKSATSLKYLLAAITPEQLGNMGKAPDIQATWQLKLK